MCDCLVALGPAAATGATLWAKNSDRPPHERQELERFAPRRDRGPVDCTHVSIEPRSGDTIGFVGSRPWWLWGVEHGVNDAGVAIGNESIFTTLDPRAAPPGLVGMDLVRLGLERGDTAEAAVAVIVDLLEAHGQGGTGHHGKDRPYWSSFLVADAGAALVVETSGRTWACERVEGTRAISNRTTIPSFDAEHRHPRQPVGTLVDPRLEASRAVLAAEPVTVAALAAHLRSHRPDGWGVCMHVPDVEATTASAIATLPAGRPALVRWLLGSPCSSVYVPVHVGAELGVPVAWERVAALGPEHRAELDALEAGLEADVTPDDGWGPEAWRRVDELLVSLGR
jgi:hypothetical protein